MWLSHSQNDLDNEMWYFLYPSVKEKTFSRILTVNAQDILNLGMNQVVNRNAYILELLTGCPLGL